jgi:flagellar hook-associated protein 3 FlgL
VTRITQQMATTAGLDRLRRSLDRTSRLQEQLSTGRALHRPSDDPGQLITAMQTRGALARTRTQLRAADNAQGWLDTADSALQSTSAMLSRVRDLVVQGHNGALGPVERENLAREVEAVRDGLVDVANTTFAGRSIFAGTADSPRAFAPDGSYLGDTGAVVRSVADDVALAVNLTGPEVFGPAGHTAFDVLTRVAADLRTNPSALASTHLPAVDAARERVLHALGEVGARTGRLASIRERATALELNLTQRLSEVESIDLPKTVMELQLQEVAYQAALSATSRVLQPSLLDFLR